MQRMHLALTAFMIACVMVMGGLLAGTRRDVSRAREEIARHEERLAALRGRETGARDVRWVTNAITRSAATELGAPGGLASVLARPDAREQLRSLVSQQIAEERDRDRLRREAEKDLGEARARERLAKELGLGPAEAQTLDEIMLAAADQRRAVADSLRSGEKNREEAQVAIEIIRAEAHEALRGRLGESRLQRVRELADHGRLEVEQKPQWLQVFPRAVGK